MHTINDKAMLENYIQSNPLFSHISSLELELFLIKYEKGELVGSPYSPLKNILFVAEGNLQIYDISEDGRKRPVAVSSRGALLGDMEFCGKSRESFFAEADTDVVCIAVPMQQARDVLSKDTQFLLFLSNSLSDKLEMAGRLNIRSQTVREKVLFYMNNVYPDGILCGIEKTAMELNCSRRQLLRVLSELCEENEIMKIGKGKYCKFKYEQLSLFPD